MVAISPPALTGATIDHTPVAVARSTAGRTWADRNQCQNTSDVTFTVTTTGLDPAQDSVIRQYQLHDGTFQEVPLTPVGQHGGSPWPEDQQVPARHGPGAPLQRHPLRRRRRRRRDRPA